MQQFFYGPPLIDILVNELGLFEQAGLSGFFRITPYRGASVTPHFGI